MSPETSPFLHAWHADLSAAPDPAPGTLAPTERQRLARLRTPALRQAYAHAHGFLRAVLSYYTGQPASELTFAADYLGKPTLANSALHFNLSYRPGRALLAVSNAGPVGADLEALLPLPNAGALVQQLFSGPEQAALRAAAPAAWWPLFYTIWTRKEAYAKALGMGLTLEFAGFSVLAATGQPAAPAGYHLHSLALAEGYFGAVATDAPLPLRQFQYPAGLEEMFAANSPFSSLLR